MGPAFDSRLAQFFFPLFSSFFLLPSSLVFLSSSSSLASFPVLPILPSFLLFFMRDTSIFPCSTNERAGYNALGNDFFFVSIMEEEERPHEKEGG
ncbi:hypothetical protein B0T09DRAFT_336601 [Sordaria sp. MPI-SDFR-AT-0083]|nr:hypothetical protein B0T09DRAFT_336601 [Sordaria sp. MPI-SDFR-AT-0083]